MRKPCVAIRKNSTARYRIAAKHRVARFAPARFLGDRAERFERGRVDALARKIDQQGARAMREPRGAAGLGNELAQVTRTKTRGVGREARELGFEHGGSPLLETADFTRAPASPACGKGRPKAG